MKLSAALLCLPGVIHAAMWPDTIGAFKRVSAAPIQLSDRPIWDEYGLREAEGARYENGSATFTAAGYRLQDPTGAMAAFQWQRPAKSTASTLAPLAAETSDSATLLHGNYVLSFDGRKPEPAELWHAGQFPMVGFRVRAASLPDLGELHAPASIQVRVLRD